MKKESPRLLSFGMMERELLISFQSHQPPTGNTTLCRAPNGINSKMLINAPKFFEVAKRIVEITEGQSW